MLRKYSSTRTHGDNVKLGSLMAFSAGMVNVISLAALFAFTSNITGHFAILANEIAKGNWYQAAVVFIWVVLFFGGNFLSNLSIIHLSDRIGSYLAHTIPIVIEMMCLLAAGAYMHHFYTETLQETEILIAVFVFAMGMHNGLTASISNFAVKTTHLTGLTTDLGILFSMFTKKEFRNDRSLRLKARLLLSILSAYILGGILSSFIYAQFKYYSVFAVCFVLGIIVIYDFFYLKSWRWKLNTFVIRNIFMGDEEKVIKHRVKELENMRT